MRPWVRACGRDLLALAAVCVGLLLVRGWWIGVAPRPGRVAMVTAAVVLFGALLLVAEAAWERRGWRVGVITYASAFAVMVLVRFAFG